MLNGDYLSKAIPFLHLDDKISDAIRLMSNYNVIHLPVVSQDVYLGIYSEEFLLQVEKEGSTIAELKVEPQMIAVSEGEHFLKALKIAVEFNLSLVPVIKENKELAGVITYSDLLKQMAEFVNVNEQGGLIILEMESKNYSFSEINRLVETNDAQITQLNTFTDPETAMMQVTLKINKLEISDIVSTFQRYEYHIKYYFGEEFYENEVRSNYDNLMNYLKI